MAIQNKPKRTAPSVDAFISGAPDAAASPPQKTAPGVKKGNKVQITVTFPPDLVADIDRMKAETGLSRAALINMGVRELVKRGITLGAAKDDA